MGFGDSVHYLKMAENPETFVGSPWGYRVAIPYLVHVLSEVFGLPVSEVFVRLQFLMYALVGVTLYVWTSQVLRLSLTASILSGVLFIFSYPGVYNLHNNIHVGYAEYIFLFLGLIFIYRQNLLILFLLIFISGFVKETIGMLLIPTYFMYTIIEAGLKSSFKGAALLSVAFLSVFILLRSGTIFSNNADMQAYSSFYTLEYLRFVFDYWGGIQGALKNILATFGPLWLLAFVGFNYSSGKLRSFLVLGILAVMQILLATDVYRMVSSGFPAIVTFAAIAVERLRGYEKFSVVLMCAASFLCLNLHLENAFIVILFVLSLLLLARPIKSQALGYIKTASSSHD